MPALSYFDLREIYDHLKDSGVVTETLPEWAASQNEATGTNDFDTGVNEGYFIKPFFNATRKFMDATGLPDVGAAIGGIFGEKGAEVGRGAVRGIPNLIPMFLAPEFAIPAMAGMAAGETYTETNDKGSALLSGVVGAAMPGVANWAEQMALKRMGGEAVRGAFMDGGRRVSVDQMFAKNLGQGLVSQVAGQGAASLLGEGSRMLEAGLREDDPNNPLSTYDFDPERIALEMTIGQIPFAAIQLSGKGKVAFGGKTTKEYVTRTREAIRDLEIKDAMTAVVPKSKLETLVPHEEKLTPEQQASVDRLMGLATPPDPTLMAAVAAAESAKATVPIGETPSTEVIDAVAKANILLDGREAKAASDLQAWKDSQPKIVVDGELEHKMPGGALKIFVLDTQNNKDQELVPGSFIQFVSHSEDFGRGMKPGETGQFRVPVAERGKTVVAGEELRMDTKRRADRQAKAESSKLNINPELPTNPDGEAAFARLREEWADHRAKAKLVKEKSDEVIAKTSDRLPDPSETVLVLQRVNEMRELAGLPKLTEKELGLLSPRIKAGDQSALSPVMQEVNQTMKVKGERADKQEKAWVEKQSKEKRKAQDIADDLAYLLSLQESTDPSVVEALKPYYKELEATQAKGEDGVGLQNGLERSFVKWYREGMEGTFKVAAKKYMTDAGRDLGTTAEGESAAQLKVDNTPAPDVVLPNTTEGLAIKPFLITDATVLKEEGRTAFEADPAMGERDFDKDFLVFQVFEKFGDAALDERRIHATAEEFLSMPHVRVWLEKSHDSYVDGLPEAGNGPTRLMAPSQRRAPAVPRVDAGDGFVWDMLGYDPATNSIGKHGLPKHGVINVAVFKNIAGEPALSNAIVELGRQQVPEAFDGDMVNVPKLMGKIGKVVEVHVYGQSGKVSEARAKLDKMTHEWFDTLDTNIQRIVSNTPESEFSKYLPDRLVENTLKYRELRSKVAAEPPDTSPRATSHYRSISPFDTEKYPVVRVDVVLPFGKKGQDSIQDFKQLQKQRLLTDAEEAEYSRLVTDKHNERELWKQDNLHENLPNTLGWAMVQFVPGPDGQTVMFVGEQQSRWGQERQKDEKRAAKVTAELKEKEKWFTENGYKLEDYAGVPIVRTLDGKLVPKEGEVKVRLEAYQRQAFNDGPNTSTPSHPLLPLQHVLVLKAAIAEAQKRGVTMMVVSDGETAMMTEGQDKVTQHKVVWSKDDTRPRPDVFELEAEARKQFPDATRYEIKTEPFASENSQGEAVPRVSVIDLQEMERPSQEGGMRLHYDTTLQSAMRSLTGDKGAPWQAKEPHKNAIKSRTQEMIQARIRELQTRRDQGDITGTEFLQQRDEILTQGGSELVGSPVFRNPDGTPKSSVTGTFYDLTQAFAKIEQRGGFTLGGKAMAPRPYEPANVVEKVVMDAYGKTPLEMLNRIATSSKNPVFNALAAHFAKYTEQLGRVTLNWHNAEDSYAVNLGRAKGDIYLSSGLIGETGQYREFVMLHEAGHQLLMHQINDPLHAKTLEAMQKLRQLAIKKLSPEMRAKYEKAVESDWYKRHADREDVEMLSENQDEADILYAMLNDDEFASQGYTNKATKDYLSGIKYEKKKTFYQKLKSFYKEFMGLSEIPEGSVYDEFLFHTSALMETGNQVAKFWGFAENWLGLKGVINPEQQRTLTDRVYGILQLGANKELKTYDILAHLDTTLRDTKGNLVNIPPKLKAAKRQLEAELSNKDGDTYAEMLDIGLKHGFEPSVKGLDDLFSNYVRGEGRWSADFEFLPSYAKKYLGEKVNDYNLVLGLAKGTLENTKFVAVKENKQMLKELAKSQAMIDKVNALRINHEVGLDLAQTITDFVPEHAFMYAHKVSAPPTPKATEVVDSFLGRSAEWVQNYLEQGAQLSRHNPLFEELWSKSALLSNNISADIKEATSALRSEIRDGVVGPMTEASKAALAKSLGDTKVLAAVEAWHYANQQEGGSAVGNLDPSHPAVKAELDKLNPTQRAQAIETMVRSGMMNAKWHVRKHKIMTDEAAHFGARYLVTKLGINLDVALEATGQMIDAVTTLQTNPQMTQVANAKLAELQSRLSPESYVGLMEYVVPAVAKLQEQKSYDAANLFFVSAQRGGKYKFSYWVNGKEVVASAKDMNEARHIAGTAKILNWRENVAHDVPDVGFDSVERQQRVAELVRNQRAALEKIGASSEVLAEYDKLDVAVQNEKDFAMAQNAPEGEFRRNRRLGKGAEYLPWMENLLNGISKSAAYWNKRLLRVQTESLLMTPDFVKDPATAKKAKTHIESLLSEDPETVRGIQKFVSMFSMGANVASYMTNGTQTAMRTFPELVREFGSLSGSANALRKAWTEYLSHKSGVMDWKTAEENAFYRQALRDGKVDASKFDESQGKFDDTSSDLISLMKRNIPKTRTERVVTAADALGQWSMGLFRTGERANATVTLMAAFRMAKAKGQDFESAMKTAYEIHAAANDVGGRANRPIGMFDNAGKFSRGVSMLASTLQSYTIGSISQLVRFGHDGWAKNNLTPAERFAAKKAALAMGSVQLAAAGVLGLPFMASILALLEETVPQFEPNKKLRAAVGWATGAGPDGQPNSLTEAFMSGFPSMVGWDLQSRLSVGNVVPGLSEYNGFQPENLLGVPVSMARNFGKGAVRMLGGDMSGASAFVPPAFRKLTNLLADDGMLKDYRDRPVFNDMTRFEKLGVAVGFNPKRLSDFNAAERMKEKARVVSNEKTYRARQEMAQAVLAGNFAQVKRTLAAKAAADNTFDVDSEVRSIAETAEALAFPRDLRDATSGRAGKSQQQVLNMFNLPASGVTEKARIMFKKTIEQRFGLVAPMRGSEVRKAERMDQLKAENPTLSRAELMRLVEVR